MESVLRCEEQPRTKLANESKNGGKYEGKGRFNFIFYRNINGRLPHGWSNMIAWRHWLFLGLVLGWL